MYNALFGTEVPLMLRFTIAFVVVIGLIALLYWGVRRFGAGALSSAAAVRGRQPRLAVIDAAAVDARRRLLLIRRDNVEHLIMIGGPIDVLIEPNIVRGTAVAPAREVAPARAADTLPRAVPLADGGIWPLQPEPMQRAPRAAPPAPPAPPPQPDEADAAWSVHPEAAPRMVPDSEPRVIPEREPRAARDREPRSAPDRDLRITPEREPRVTREREPRPAPDRELRIAAEREPRATQEPELRITPEREPRAAPAAASRTAVDGAPRGQNSERLAGLAADLSRTYSEPVATSAPPAPSTPPPPPAARSAEPRRPPPVPAQTVSETDEQNLTEMAQQLEFGAAAPTPGRCPGHHATGAAHRSPARAAARGCQTGHEAGNQAGRQGWRETRVRQPRAGDGQLARPSARESVKLARSGRRVRLATVAAGIGLVLAFTAPAGAQDISINFGQGGGLTERVLQLIALMTVLSLAPSILVMVTSFTRIVVVLSLLRTALGTATAPPNTVLISLALFLTAFVMAPTFERSYEIGIKPLMANQITTEQAFERSSGPLRDFMLKNVREKDLKLFMDLSHEATPAKPEDVSLRVLVPAFMISELKRAFEIGFLLFLPFLIIDLVVASVLMSMGMMMLPPVVVSLPFKLIFFVLVDGWSLVAGSLVQSYGT